MYLYVRSRFIIFIMRFCLTTAIPILSWPLVGPDTFWLHSELAVLRRESMNQKQTQIYQISKLS